MGAEHAAIGVQLVDDDHAQVREQRSPAAVVGQQAVMQDVGVGEQDRRRIRGQLDALIARGIAS